MVCNHGIPYEYAVDLWNSMASTMRSTLEYHGIPLYVNYSWIFHWRHNSGTAWPWWYVSWRLEPPSILEGLGGGAPHKPGQSLGCKRFQDDIADLMSTHCCRKKSAEACASDPALMTRIVDLPFSVVSLVLVPRVSDFVASLMRVTKIVCDQNYSTRFW